ncbi:MAG: cbb3-type cytochrome oxidase subunit 3 [Bdellovibrionales bacterium]
MMDWLIQHGGMLVTVMFFVLFIAIAFWAYRPANKSKMQSYGDIPLKANDNGE